MRENCRVSTMESLPKHRMAAIDSEIHLLRLEVKSSSREDGDQDTRTDAKKGTIDP